MIVRDRDGDGTFDPGVDGTQADAFGLSTDNGRLNFDERRVRAALREAGLQELRPGARLHRIGAYLDMVREADRMLREDGDHAEAARQLELAQRFACEQGICIDIVRFGDLRWRAVFLAYSRGAEGVSDLKGDDLTVLAGDGDAETRQFSAQLILEYAATWAEIRRVEAASGFVREDLYTRVRELRTTITGRARLLRETGSADQRVFPIVSADPLPAVPPPYRPPSRWDRVVSRVRGVLRGLIAEVGP